MSGGNKSVTYCLPHLIPAFLVFHRALIVRLNLAAFEPINLPANLDVAFFARSGTYTPRRWGKAPRAGVSRNSDRLTWRSFRPLLP